MVRRRHHPHALALAYLYDGRVHEALQRDVEALPLMQRMQSLPEVAGDAMQPLWRRNPRWTEAMES